jgi:hypothetical protein
VKYLALLAVLACTDPVAPDCDVHHLRASVISSHDATASFMAQLEAGTGDIVLDGTVYLPDTLDLAPYITTHTISIQGSGGFTSRAAIVGHLKLSKLRDWEVRMRDVTIYQGSVNFEYVQLSTFDGVRVQESDFTIHASTRLTFRDSYFYKSSAFIGGGNSFLWSGGAIEGGSFTLAGNGAYAGPVTFDDPHLEFATLSISNMRGVTLRGGYYLASEVLITNSTDVVRERGEWLHSSLNGEGVCS